LEANVVSIRRIAAFGVLCLMLVHTGAAATRGAPKAGQRPVKSIMICYFLNESDYRSRSVGAALGRMLRYRASNLYQLSNIPPLDVVERVMQEEKLPGGLSLNTSNALKVARSSGQELAVVGTVKRTGVNYRAMAYIYSSSTGREIGNHIMATSTEFNLHRLEARLSAAVFGGIGVRFSVRQRADLAKPLTSHYDSVRFLGDYLLARPKDAPAFLKRLTGADPSFPLGAVNRVDSLLDSHRYWDALMVARDWSARLPSNRDFSSYEFGALLATGRVSEAPPVLRKMETIYPGSFSVALLRYWLLRLEGDDRGAAETARRLTVLNPASSEAYRCYAAAALRLALRTGGASNARIACLAAEKAVLIDPKYKDAWLTLMAAYRERRDFNRSLLAFRSLIALDARNGDALSSEALNYLCKSDVKSARKLWSEAFHVDPKRAEALVGLALCARMSGDSALAGGHLRRAAAADRRCLDATYLRREKYWPTQLAQAVAALNSGKRR
jgi:tetratricopeptide (TPR) repeat protein